MENKQADSSPLAAKAQRPDKLESTPIPDFKITKTDIFAKAVDLDDESLKISKIPNGEFV